MYKAVIGSGGAGVPSLAVMKEILVAPIEKPPESQKEANFIQRHENQIQNEDTRYKGKYVKNWEHSYFWQK